MNNQYLQEIDTISKAGSRNNWPCAESLL